MSWLYQRQRKTAKKRLGHPTSWRMVNLLHLRWICKDQRPIGPCVNQDIVDELNKLVGIHESRLGGDDKWKVLQYRKAISSIRKETARITSLSQAQGLFGVGKKTATKIMEIVENGKTKRLEYEEQLDDTRVCKLFSAIYGVGPRLAWQWYQLGLRTLQDVREGKAGVKLTPAQRIGLEHYDDLQLRMPREEAGVIFGRIKEIALAIDPELDLQLMGSYRRGQPNCGDIDILITRPDMDGRTHKGIMRKLLPALHEKDILTKDLSMPHDLDDLEAKYMGLCRLGPDGKMRRIDILAVPYASWGAALLYFTGDDIFNRSMRLLASSKGYSLNQRGLYKNVVRDPKTRVKTVTGTLIASRTEEDIFAILGVPWQEPAQRRRAK
ncbi:hypothetical protein BOTBODRAFT_461341 [Botryobasidium botryosum FD-172 SS1]|uniref:DNA polymerase n=1 Tax=Botryobasidium botryosum (strain FD-172 SS1) TaxID=930990 RepID=A0A067MHZ1_BOTB1|nr:hypothetical protein BOTBODRAFT_461341 [Botryobasidium botryosum FD-172 SS1]